MAGSYRLVTSNRFSAADKALARSMRVEGKSHKDIAAALHCDLAQTYSVARTTPTKPGQSTYRRKKWTMVERAQANDMERSGMSFDQIGAALGRSEASVLLVLRKPAPQGRDRPCMTCGKVFPSEHVGVRMCMTCRLRSSETTYGLAGVRVNG